MSYGTTVSTSSSSIDPSCILSNSLTEQTSESTEYTAFGIPYRPLLIKLKHDSLLVQKIKRKEKNTLNVNFMPSSSSPGPVKACEILLHHCPSFYHKPSNSAIFPLSALMPSRAKAKIQSSLDSKD